MMRPGDVFHGMIGTVRDLFSTDATGLPEAMAPETIDLADGATYVLTARPVRKRLGDAEVRMLAYNGSIPGPTLRISEGATVVIDFMNQADYASSVHWHGLRLENRFDGTHETQSPVPVGETFSYRVACPDPGLYWYHPHIREDYGQELGLYGNILVVPSDPAYWPPVHREVLLTLDDILVEDGKVAPFARSEITYAVMGRYGDHFLVNGEPTLTMTAQQGEVIRFYLTNTANARVFNIALPGARMKLVGGDSGRIEREQFVESVIVGPSERVVVDVLLEQPGSIPFEHRSLERTVSLGEIQVDSISVALPLVERFEALRHNPEWAVVREWLASYIEAPLDKTLALVAELDIGMPEELVIYACPMHPEVTSSTPGHCPICGMALIPVAAPVQYVCPMHPEIARDQPGRCPICGMKLVAGKVSGEASALMEHGDHSEERHPEPQSSSDSHGHGQPHHEHEGHRHRSEHTMMPETRKMHEMPEMGDISEHSAHTRSSYDSPEDRKHHPHPRRIRSNLEGIEWEDDMVEFNRRTTSANTRWNIVDRTTGEMNHAIDWEFRVGDRVKVRIVNEMDSDHPMQHPFHVHGAGRFVVLARNGVGEANLGWKDTVLIRTGDTVDLVLDVTNPGIWMAHCHIAEHHESGMAFSFRVVE